MVETYEYTMDHVGLNLEVFDDPGTRVQTVSNIPVIQLNNNHTVTSTNESVKGEEIEPISTKPDANDPEIVSQTPVVVAHNLYTAMSADGLDVSVQNKENEDLNPESDTFNPETVSKIPLSHVRNTDDVTCACINLSDSSVQSKGNETIITKSGANILEFQNNAQNVSIARNDENDENTNLYLFDQAINAETVLVPAQSQGDMAHDNHVHMKATENDNLVHMKGTDNDNHVYMKATENDNLVHMKGTENGNHVHMNGTEKADKGDLTELAKRRDKKIAVKETLKRSGNVLKEEVDRKLRRLGSLSEKQGQSDADHKFTGNHSFVRSKPTNACTCTSVTSRTKIGKCTKNADRTNSVRLTENFETAKDGSLTKSTDKTQIDDFKFKINKYFDRIKTGRSTEILDLTKTDRLTKNTDTAKIDRFTKTISTTKTNRFTKNVDTTKTDRFTKAVDKDLNDSAFEKSSILDTNSQSREYSAEYIKSLLRQKLTSGQDKQANNKCSNQFHQNAGRQFTTATGQSCTESNRCCDKSYNSFESLTAISELCNRIEYDPACKYNRTSSLLQPSRRKAAHKRPKLSERFRTAWNESIKNFSLEWFHSKSGYKQDNSKTSHCKSGAVDFSSTQVYRHLHHSATNQMALQSPKIAGMLMIFC